MGYPVRINLAFSLIESAPACPVHQVSKLVCINSPPPGAAIAGPRASTGAGCGGPRLAAAPAAGPGLLQRRLRARACRSTGTRRLRRWRRRPAASAGTGRGDVPADVPAASLVSVGTASAAGSGQSDDDDTSRLVDGAVELLVLDALAKPNSCTRGLFS